jgi:4-hydroxy-2-oxoheptanedioate aldolase
MSVLPRVLVKGINFKKLLFSGNRLSGAWSTLGSSDVSILMANAGLDYILIDLEHGLGGIDGVARQVQALLGLETAVVVRLPDHDTSSIKRILDAGANAILAPQIDNKKQAEKIIEGALFSPKGRRGVAVGAIAASNHGYLPEAYYHNANKALTILTQVESVEAVNVLDDILETPHLDGIFFGPNDFSASMNKFREYEDPEFLSIYKKIRDITLASGKLFGALPFPGQDANTLFNSGATIVPNGSDQAFLRLGASKLVEKTKKVKKQIK